MSQKKEKIGVSLPVATVKLADENLSQLGFLSRSELIDAAVNEYVTLHTLSKFPDELAEIYNQYKKTKYIVAVYESGNADLLSGTKSLLSQNRDIASHN